MNKWCFLLLLKSILSVNVLLAQDAFLFTKQADLPSDIINCIAIENTNKLWVATEEGLVKLTKENSGKTTIDKVFQSTKDPALFKIQSIAIDHTNQKWLGTYRSSLVKLNEKKPNNSQETVLLTQGKKQLITSLYFKTPTVWAGTESGQVVSYNIFSKKIEVNGKPTTNNIYSIYSNREQSGKQIVTVGTTSGLYQKQVSPYQKQVSQWHKIPATFQIKFWERLQAKAQQVLLNQTYKILDYQDKLWVIGQDQEKQANVQTWASSRQEQSYEVSCIPKNYKNVLKDFDFDNQGNMWLVTDKQVLHYNPIKNECLQTIPLPNTLSKVNNLVIQDAATIWIGSEGDGLYQLLLTDKIQKSLADLAKTATTPNSATTQTMQTSKDLQCGQKLILPNLRFQRGRAAYMNLERAEADLDTIVVYLQRNPTTILELSGHTDGGTAYFATQLSKSRVVKAKNYLLSQGIESQRITTRFVGGREPLSYSAEDKKRAKNRRVEVKVICE